MKISRIKNKINNQFTLFKYRLEYNDITFKRKVKVLSISFIMLILVIIMAFSTPLHNLRESLLAKSKEYIANQENIELLFAKNTKNVQSDATNNVPKNQIPIHGTITSGYGMRNAPYKGMHTGIDISGIHHDNVRSVANGTVTFSGSQNGYGYCIEIKHDNYYSFYAHLSKIKVKVGDQVAKGSIIGIEGGDPRTDPNPGNSTGHHLHFEIRTNSGYGHSINPTPYIWK